MFWRILRAWRLLRGCCPACNVPLSTCWGSNEAMHFLEYCHERHYACLDNDPELEVEGVAADALLKRWGL